MSEIQACSVVEGGNLTVGKSIGEILSEDERRLNKLGYKQVCTLQTIDSSNFGATYLNYSSSQEVKRIFGLWSNFGLAASMISVILGIIPLYTYSLTNGGKCRVGRFPKFSSLRNRSRFNRNQRFLSVSTGPAVMVWSWIVIGSFTLILVSCLAEISCAYPTMGALYYWSFRLGGEEWGPFASWMSGWTNLLGEVSPKFVYMQSNHKANDIALSATCILNGIGQIAGVASGGYSGAEVIADIIQINYGYVLAPSELLGVFALVLALAGVINTFAEQLLTRLCSISVIWHTLGTIIIVSLMIHNAPTLQPSTYTASEFNNGTSFQSSAYVVLIGSLSAASTFTGATRNPTMLCRKRAKQHADILMSLPTSP